jgi:hypothetical protein
MLRQPDPHPGTAPVYPEVLRLLRLLSGLPCTPGFGSLPFLEKLIQERVDHGIRKYGRVLEAHNGRNALVDAWEESVDLVFYLQQAEMEGQEVQQLLHLATTLLFGLTRLAERDLGQ